jgi:hypothetical protein
MVAAVPDARWVSRVPADHRETLRWQPRHAWDAEAPPVAGGSTTPKILCFRSPSDLLIFL